MDKNKPEMICLKNYQPSAYLIEHVDCHLTLEPTQTQVRSRLKIYKNQKVSSNNHDLILDGNQLDLLEVKLNDIKLKNDQYTLLNSTLTIPNIHDKTFVVETSCLINPKENTALQGLYLSNDIFCTQCEPEGFRRITYYIDRPDNMATFTTTIVADKDRYPVLLANGDCIDKGDLPNNKHWVKWHDKAKKPSYLFALVAGNLVCQRDQYTTLSGKKVAIHFYIEKGNEHKCQHGIQSLKKAMEWDEKRYQREYDLDTYMIVAINDFNMGAMENKGLNIFNAKCVLADPNVSSDIDYAWIQAVVAHEYFHNWTGNRITCRDWFQLSLKEGLTVFREQQFCQDQMSEVVQRINNVKALWTRQFPEDAGPLAHPVQPESYLEINNFYTMTIYEKGAEVLRMLPWILGEKGYYQGMQYYFEHYDGQAVTIEDLIHAMEKGNQCDLQQFLLWYKQAGTPEVTIEAEFNHHQKQYQLHLSQYCPDTPGQKDKKPMMIPVVIGLMNEQGKPLIEQKTLILHERKQTFTFNNIHEKPIPSLGREYSAPVKFKYPYTDDELYTLASFDSDGFNRWQAIQSIYHDTIQQQIDAFQQHQIIEIDKPFFNLHAQLLSQKWDDKLLQTQSLSLPTHDEIAVKLAAIDVEGINHAYKQIMQQLAGREDSKLFDIYQSLQRDVKYSYTPEHYGRRSLIRYCLVLLNYLPNAQYQQLAREHYYKADNLTDRLTALFAVNNQMSDIRDELLQTFYRDWHHEAFTLDSWFQIHAYSRLPNSFDEVKQLSRHESFNLKNPNRVRALIGAWSYGLNPNFHRKDGAGYHLLTEFIVKLDDTNSHLAAYLLQPFTQWRRYDKQRQQLMRECLQQIQRKPNLSKDCQELVTKSLVPSS